MRIPNGLVDAVRQRQAVLFAGAGMSYSSFQILGNNIRDVIGAEIQKDYANYNYSLRTLEDVCEEYVALNDRISLVNRLAGLIPQNASPTESHIAAVEAFRFIITTNWDLLFEEAYKRIGQGYSVLSSNADAPNFNYDQHNLLKIHGSIDKPLTMIATSEDYEGYIVTHDKLVDRIAELVHNNTVLFVGYGIRDENVRQLLTRIRLQRGPWARRSYAVGYFDDVRTRLLDKRNIEALNVAGPTNEPGSGLDMFLPELARRAGYP